MRMIVIEASNAANYTEEYIDRKEPPDPSISTRTKQDFDAVARFHAR